MSKTTSENTVQTFYKANPADKGGQRLERAVYSESDAVAARFDGYFPDSTATKDKVATKTPGNSGSGSSSS